MVFGTYTSPVKLDSVTLFSEQGQQKYRKEEPLAKAEILKEGLYTILPFKNPICIDTLNRLFYKEMQKSDLKIVFALSLVDRLIGDTIHSHLSFVNMLTAHLRNSSGELTLCISTRKLSTAMNTIRLSKGHEIRAIQALLEAEQLSLPKDAFICNVWLCQKSGEIAENAFATGISRLNAALKVLHVKVVVTENTVSLSLIG